MIKDEVLEKVVSRVREHLPDETCSQVEGFVRQYYGWVPEQDLTERDPVDVYGAAVSHWNCLQKRRPGEAKIRVYNPQHEANGWQSTHTVVEIVNDDMPFLVDSVSMELSRLGHGIHLMFHPIIVVKRDSEGELLELLPPESDETGTTRESVIHVEIDRRTEPEVLKELHRDLERVLTEVRAAVEDWQPMKDRISQIVTELGDSNIPADEVREISSFLEWLVAGHFTFTGSREYTLGEEDGDEVLNAVPDSGLGILRNPGQNDGETSTSFSKLPPESRRIAHDPNPLNLTKSNSKSRVHRPAHLDYVGIKTFDPDGNVTGERRFLGLYTSAAYNAHPHEIPLARRKIAYVIEKAGFPQHSHYEKSLVEVFESYPRDQLLQSSGDELYDIAMGVLQLQERQRVRLFVRQDTFGRFLSCLVFVPRERYDTDARKRIQEVLEREFGATDVDFSVQLSESVLARLYFIVYTEPSGSSDFDIEDIEAKLTEATRTWTDSLYDTLVEGFGEERGTTLFHRYREAFPAGYKEDFLSRRAYPDIQKMESLESEEDLGMSLYHQLEEPENYLRFKLFRRGRLVSLSEVLPLLEDMGVRVMDELGPYEIRPNGSSDERFWMHDFGLIADRPLDTGEVRGIFQETFARMWDYEIEEDGFNRLVLKAELDWREISVLRACCKYLRQTNLTFSQSYMESTLSDNPHIARLLVRLFKARFDPRRQGSGSYRSEAVSERLTRDIEAALDDVSSLDEDRIIRSFLNIIRAIVRTNFYQTTDSGEPKEYLSFKFDPEQIPELPLPKPQHEIFVYSPRMEGVHLRGGEVARGGLRWSDRREDFRTEVLGLMKAQMVKNAVIVPVGSKGGFVVKRPPTDGGREAMQEEVVHCYKTLIRGMLDLTDNLVGGETVHPQDVVRYDGDDPYLVVAADKGTATFSDIANGVSADYGFWLGDAFASGGSVGYDHKAMGITAKGAWESVRRHFRDMGMDVQEEDFTVVGIGDMGGDVFGNGMLLSRHIKLVGAFNHLHIFLDPNPDPEVSFEERKRLFELPGSLWTDYDRSLISEGGGVYPRTAKSVALSPQVKEMLGVDADQMTPTDLINALLKSGVDLLWNGGIGTYVKSSEEANSEVGDRANDGLRVNGSDLRCRVVGEGGNLGMTQRGRIEYALGGGRVYMDAVDNSAGVDCSDHEVNIKILLDAIVESGDMTEKQRNELLASMTDEVGRLVLRDNYLQTQALSNASAQVVSMSDVLARYLAYLESSGKLDRSIEFLPTEDEIGDRKSRGVGLTTPELAVILSYTKLTLYQRLLGSDALDDEYLADELYQYFPKPLTENYSDRMRDHRLRRQIVATVVVNSLVNRCGMTFAYRMSEETGAEFPDIARAYTAAQEIFSLRNLWREVEALDNVVSSEVQTGIYLKARRLLERSTRWLIRNAQPLDIGEAVGKFRSGAEELAGQIPNLLMDGGREALDAEVERLIEEGVPEPLAQRVAVLETMYSALDIVDVSERTSEAADVAASVYFTLGDRMNLRWLREKIDALPRDNRWRTLARAALRDDLYSQQASLTADILMSTPGAEESGERIQAWAESNQRAVDRSIQVIRDVNQAGVYDLSTLPVILREIRNLTGSSHAATAR